MFAEQLPWLAGPLQLAVALPREWVGVAAVAVGTTLAAFSGLRFFLTRSVANDRADEDSETKSRSPSRHRITVLPAVSRVEERTGR
ncbi:hypothetical protein SAMN04487820_103166 [Actinopolyspora mzabensis]|uniref:Uncharacterized protein n=1 Tax=Actinopolyspora mzabensis TaxID=995066 RepID=A0A1G8Y0P4_ACTMZ|nr:hypothetical protein [Actinopolyspora mzabensis]SDJ96014.1 hypothetical protein SAMN04487820_103166 [Actinopolyspora mzabensis]